MAQPTLIERKTRTVRMIAQNKKARHDFHIESTIEVGIVLVGTEVKSLRAGKCSLQDAYCYFPSKTTLELVIANFQINPYDHGNRENHEPKRQRRLLIRAKESERLRAALQEKGFTLVALSAYFSGPYVKLELGLAKGKKLFDKRESEKDRDSKRELQRVFKR